MAELDHLRTLVKLGREERFLEYKESGPWDNLKEKIAKTAIGMANIRDGGTIILGVSQRGGRFEAQGLSEEHVASYDGDRLQDYIHEFADPYVRSEFHTFDVDNKQFLAIVIHEFDEVPVICRRDSAGTVRGRVYTRSHRKPETCEVPSQTEMRDIIELATDKAIARFIQRLQRAGLIEPVKMGPFDAERFGKQREGL